MLKKLTQSFIIISFILSSIRIIYNNGIIIPNLSQIVDIMWSLSVVFIIIFISVTIRKRFQIKINDSELSIIILSLTDIILILSRNMIPTISLLMHDLFGFILSILFIIIVFEVVVGSVCNMYKNNADKWLLDLSYQQNVYEVDRIQHMYDEARKLRHDMKQCIISAKYHIDNKEYDEAKQYLNSLIVEKVDVMGYVKYCNNRVLNYIINDKFEKCRKHDIETKCIVNGDVSRISEIDMSILLGNILDNAIEAAILTEHASVNLELFVDHSIHIIVENSIKESIIHNINAFETTKKDKNIHGYGMQSIRDIVKKYHGSLVYNEENKMMVCIVILNC